MKKIESEVKEESLDVLEHHEDIEKRKTMIYKSVSLVEQRYYAS